MKEVQMFTDGACGGNPGPGGYGCILIYKGHEKELHGGEKETTNNRMELTAVIAGLEQLKEPCRVKITSDSKYVTDSVNLGWVYQWERNGWRKADRKEALNVDLWQRLPALLEIHEVTFEWIKGHNGHEYNERCDRMAVAEVDAHR
ncbi:MAG: ribonuclease HI [Clostridiales bacterium]|nr:ribonuclease HI [Clostridiales bacterium]